MTQEEIDAKDTTSAVALWLQSKGFVRDRGNWCIAWSDRGGHDFTDLEFYPWHHEQYPDRWDAIIGHHASGTNPRMVIGTCDTLAEVQEIYDVIRRLNGYRGPEPERGPEPSINTETHTVQLATAPLPSRPVPQEPQP